MYKNRRRHSIAITLILVLLCISSARAAEATDAPMVTIRSIEIIVHDVFDTSLPKENGGFYRVVNALHIQTRKKTVRQQLEFAEGDTVELGTIIETERVLRAIRYIRDAHIDISDDHTNADIAIHVYDTWSTKIKVNANSKGGTTNFELGLKEENFLGKGVGLGLSYKKDIDHTYSILKLSKDHLGGGDLRVNGEYADTDGGFVRSIALDKPYRYFDNPNAFGVSFDDQELTQGLYFQGESYFDYFQKKQDIDLFYSINTLRNDYSFKHYIGWHRTELTHKPVDEQVVIENEALLAYTLNKDFLPDDKQLSYPYYQISVQKNDFTKRKYFDGIGSTEDHHLGLDTSLRIGYIQNSPTEGNAQTYLSFSSKYTVETPQKGLAMGQFTTQFRSNGSDLSNAISQLHLKYYLPQTHHLLFFSEFQVSHAHNLDGGQQLFSGEQGETRGYPSRYISAGQIERLTFEQRYYNHNQIWRLFNFGCVLFVDIIHASGGTPLEAEYNNLFKTVGFGLRVANNRSSLSDTIHLDFSKPINPADGVDHFQINISSKKYF